MKLTRSFAMYYRLTKPGIIYGNVLPTVAGFFVASQQHINFRLFFAVIIGQSFIIAAGCVLNNVHDRNIDTKMDRTKKRALVTGDIGVRSALIWSVILGLIGTAVLQTQTNMLTLFIGLFGLFAYVVLYGVAKRVGSYGTLVGSISGALPPVAGYTAVSGHLDWAAAILFLILVCWQMPHFYAIAIYRMKDYLAAGIPVLPIQRGIKRTKLSMVVWTAAFSVAAALLSVYGYTGWFYIVSMSILAGSWLGIAVYGQRSGNDERWARKMFFVSLIVLMGWCGITVLSRWLP